MNYHQTCKNYFITILLRLITKLRAFYTLLDYGLEMGPWQGAGAGAQPCEPGSPPGQLGMTPGVWWANVGGQQQAGSWRVAGGYDSSNQGVEGPRNPRQRPTEGRAGNSLRLLTILLRFYYDQAAKSFRESGPRNLGPGISSRSWKPMTNGDYS